MVWKKSPKCGGTSVDAITNTKQRQQVGGNDLPPDGDGKIRRAILYLNLTNGDYLIVLSLKLALLYLKLMVSPKSSGE